MEQPIQTLHPPWEHRMNKNKHNGRQSHQRVRQQTNDNKGCDQPPASTASTNQSEGQ